MKMEVLKKRLYVISVIVLVIGLSSAIGVYLTAKNNSDSTFGFEVINGNVYPIDPENSKRYIHDLERYGGKANVLANEFISWFLGLWHGTSLAYSIGCITILVSFGCYLIANQLPSRRNTESNDGNTRL